MNFDIKITTPRGVYKSGKGLSQYFGNMFDAFERIIGEPEMDALAEIVKKSNKQNIAMQRKASGQPLGEWAESTRKARMRKGRMGMKLYDTGKMFHSIDYTKTGTLSREILVDVPYAGYVQFAKSKKWTFFGVSKFASEEMRKYLIELLRSRTRQAA